MIAKPQAPADIPADCIAVYVSGGELVQQPSGGAVVGFGLPAGVILPYGGTTAPTGWLLCDGSAVSRTVYAALFAVIGTSFGAGNGSTTFNLPNTARRTLVGAGGSGTATLANTVGATGGSETHTLSTAEMPTHNHTVTDPGHYHGGSMVYYTGTSLNLAVGAIGSTGTTANTTTGISVNNAGSGGSHNNVQPSLVVNCIIKE